MFTDRNLRYLFGEPTFSRGQAYFRQGMVKSVEFEADTVLMGEVAGSWSNAYQLSVALEFEHDDTLRAVAGICTCPAGFNCPHVVALLLAAADRRAPEPGARGADPSDPVPREVRQWLDRWPGADRTPAEAAAPGPPAPGQEHVFYVVSRDQAGGGAITPYQAYLKKDGNIGKNLRKLDPRFHRMARRLTRQDGVLLDRLRYYAEAAREAHAPWPAGGVLVDLVREIVATGRARAHDIHGGTLAWAAPRDCTLAWEVVPVGNGYEQRLAARDGTGTAVTLLPFATPLFMDARSGEIGIARTPLAPHHAAWLAAAPGVPLDAQDAVKSKLLRMGQDDAMPRLQPVEERTGVRPEPLLVLFGVEEPSTQYVPRKRGGLRATTVTVVYPCVRLEIAYHGARKRPHAGAPGRHLLHRGRRPVVIRRDRAAESSFRKTLVQAAERHGGAPPNRPLRPSGHRREVDLVFPVVGLPGFEDATVAGVGFMAREVPALRAQGWGVRVDRSWPFAVHDGPVTFSTSLESSESDWFSLSLSMEANGQSFDALPFILQIVEGLPVDPLGGLEQGFDVDRHLADLVLQVRLDDGAWVEVEGARFARFVEAFLEAQGLTGFHRAEAGRLLELATALEGSGAPWKGGRAILDLGARLQALAAAPETEPPAALRGTLRPYQRTGYGWLRTLSGSGFGGVLADDMGLGKTVQALALLAHRHLEERTDRPSLVVVPTSLVGNWRREAQQFVPDLKVLVLHGPDREQRFADIPGSHLVVTTYPLVRRDHQALFRHEYDTVVLDEAQTVKNPAAAVAKRIREISARHRLALTGTPLENSLQELWALYDWLIPGLLGTRKNFTAQYRTPIEKRGDRAKQRLLSTRVKPFLLRRTKEQVASELPDKTIIDEVIPLEGSQAALYESIRTAMDARIRDAIAARGLAASRITVLDALLKLRQVCCDPRLVKLDAARKVAQSAKRERLLALLEELVAERRKVLVFSQFVELLRIIEADVAARGWRYAMLHGGTVDRDAQIASFQTGDVPLFLISLKAGGTGLNLTAADSVIIYDPWWNPAVERQAMDRAHRIGQDKPVFVHRLIAANTVEAAIQKMQVRKQALADALFEGTGQGPMALTEADVAALFAGD